MTACAHGGGGRSRVMLRRIRNAAAWRVNDFRAWSVANRSIRRGSIALAAVPMVLPVRSALAQQAAGPSVREGATGTAPTSWAGTWLLQRDDPRIRTREGAATLRVEVRQDPAGSVALNWIADRGICEDPDASPCEWVSAQGSGVAVAVGSGALAALLRISADPDDPFLLLLERGAGGRVMARLVSEKGGIAYRLNAERE